MIIQCELVGRVGKVPQEIGGAGVRFSVAVDTKKDQPSLWVDVVCFGKTAELAASWVTEPGQIVFVTGRPEAKAYIAKDGTAKCSLSVVASAIRILTYAKKQQVEEQEQQWSEKSLESLEARGHSFVTSPAASALPF